MTRWLDTLRHVLRYALRMLRRSSAFTGAAILSLALGIGATTAILFSVIDAVVLEPFAEEDPEHADERRSAAARSPDAAWARCLILSSRPAEIAGARASSMGRSCRRSAMSR